MDSSPVNQPVDARATTFKLLARHDSPETAELLLTALTGDDPRCRQCAVEAVVQHRSQLLALQVIRCVESLHDDVCVELGRCPERFLPAIQQSLSRNGDDAQKSAVSFLRRTGNASHCSDLLTLMEGDDKELREEIAVTIRQLCAQLATRMINPAASVLLMLNQSEVSQLQQEALAQLDARLSSSTDLKFPEPLIEGVLLLGRPDSEAVLNILDRRGERSREIAANILRCGSHPALLNVICRSLERHSPVPIIFDIVRFRDDLPFATHLLEWLPTRPTRYIEASFRKIARLPWLMLGHRTVNQLPTHLHDRLVELVRLLSMPAELVAGIKSWIVRNSGAAGRSAASDVLDTLPSDEVQHILYEALDGGDSAVEAWATRQLRSQQIPDTFTQLLQRLDRDDETVRGAAREELADFNLNRLLDLFPRLPDETARRCGVVIEKIDPGTAEQLCGELRHSYRWRRVRALRAAGALGLVQRALSTVMDSLGDPEPTVRRTALEVLSRSGVREALHAIRGLVDDPSRGVRSAAREALDRLERRQVDAPRSAVG